MGDRIEPSPLPPAPEIPPSKGLFRRVGEMMPFGGPDIHPTTRPVVQMDEVYALLNFAANKGIKGKRILDLSNEVHKATPDPSVVASLYANLVSSTQPVTGRTLLDSGKPIYRRLYGISTVTAVFFVLAIGNTIVDSWVADMVEPEQTPLWLNLKRYAWDYLTPFFWGGLGACVFLLKKVQDAAKENVYEDHLLQGWGTRVLIGGVLAAIVLIIFDPTTFTGDALPLRPAAIAFLVGLGVKAVYGALERVIEEIASRVSVENIRREPAPSGGDKSNG